MVVFDIEDFLAADTNKVMMRNGIGFQPQGSMVEADLAGQPGIEKSLQILVDGGQ